MTTRTSSADARAVHVITRSTGTYETTECLVAAFTSEAEAARFIIAAEDEWKAAVAGVPDRTDYPDDNAPDAAWTNWKRRRLRAWRKFRGMLACDPDAAPENEWSSPEEPTYYSSNVALFASAIDARRESPNDR